MTLDENNNLIIVGAFSGIVDFDPNAGIANINADCSGQNATFVCSSGYLAKYNSDGEYLQARLMSFNNNGNTYPTAVAYHNNLIFTMGRSGLLQRWNVSNLSPAGEQLALTLTSNPWNNWAGGIVADASGVYVTGRFEATNNFGGGEPLNPTNGRIFIVKYTNTVNLTPIWKQQIGSGSVLSGGMEVALSPDGRELYVSAFDNSVATAITLLAKFNTNTGNFVSSWGTNGIKTFENISGGTTFNGGLAVHPVTGSVIIGGTMLSATNPTDFGNGVMLPPNPDIYNLRMFLAEFKPDGECIWAKPTGTVYDPNTFFSLGYPLNLAIAGQDIFIGGLLYGELNLNMCGGGYNVSSDYYWGFIAKYKSVTPDLIYNFNPVITGSNNICNNAETYTATYYEGASYTWEVSSNITIVSVNANTITVSQNTSSINGQGWIKVTATRYNACINYTSSKIIQKNIWVGKPGKPYIVDSNILPPTPLPEPYVFSYLQSRCPNDYAEITLISKGAEYMGSQRSDSTQQKTYRGSEALLQIPLNQPVGTYVYQVVGLAGRPRRQGCISDITTITVIIKENKEGNICVKKEGEEENIATRIYPNPTKDLLNIETEAIRYVFFNKYSQKVMEGNIDNQKILINVRNIPKDVYILHLIYEDGFIERKQVIVNE